MSAPDSASLTIADLRDHLDAAPVLAAWFACEWGDGTPAMAQAAIAERLAAQTDPDTLPITLLGLLADDPVATVTLKYRELDWAPGADYWLGSLYVREDLRGRGFARTMLDAAETAAAAAGSVPLYLYSPAKVALYRHLGWEPVGETIVGAKQATIPKHECRTSTAP